jgi:hypothetical protein
MMASEASNKIQFFRRKWKNSCTLLYSISAQFRLVIRARLPISRQQKQPATKGINSEQDEKPPQLSSLNAKMTFFSSLRSGEVNKCFAHPPGKLFLPTSS